MTANKYKILLPTTDKEIVLPIELKWDFLDRSDSLKTYEENAVKEILNQEKDFEVIRFQPDGILNVFNNTIDTEMNYEFNFVPSGVSITNAVWSPSYLTQGFTAEECYRYRNSFRKSFFKLDLYDSTETKSQTNYITIILTPQMGQTTTATVGWNNVNIKTPTFKLDFLGFQEGYFIYWLKSTKFLNINTFYMTAKFFDAKVGEFVKMMNRPQSSLPGDQFNFPQDKFFYYKVVLDYSNNTYKIFDINSGGRVGQSSSPIKWYEYINPT